MMPSVTAPWCIHRFEPCDKIDPGTTDLGNGHYVNCHLRDEAEKSHQKAKVDGYVECWTVVHVDRIDIAMAKQESPSTNRFYRISQIAARTGKEYEEFESRIVSLLGIPSRSYRKKSR